MVRLRRGQRHTWTLDDFRLVISLDDYCLHVTKHVFFPKADVYDALHDPDNPVEESIVHPQVLRRYNMNVRKTYEHELKRLLIGYVSLLRPDCDTAEGSEFGNVISCLVDMWASAMFSDDLAVTVFGKQVTFVSKARIGKTKNFFTKVYENGTVIRGGTASTLNGLEDITFTADSKTAFDGVEFDALFVCVDAKGYSQIWLGPYRLTRFGEMRGCIKCCNVLYENYLENERPAGWPACAVRQRMKACKDIEPGDLLVGLHQDPRECPCRTSSPLVNTRAQASVPAMPPASPSSSRTQASTAKRTARRRRATPVEPAAPPPAPVHHASPVAPPAPVPAIPEADHAADNRTSSPLSDIHDELEDELEGERELEDEEVMGEEFEYEGMEEPEGDYEALGEPGAGYEAAEEPDVEYEAGGEPDVEYEAAGEPDAEYEAAGEPDVEYEAAEEPEVDEPEVDEPGVDEAEVDRPVGEAEIDEPGVDEPEVDELDDDDSRLQNNNVEPRGATGSPPASAGHSPNQLQPITVDQPVSSPAVTDTEATAPVSNDAPPWDDEDRDELAADKELDTRDGDVEMEDENWSSRYPDPDDELRPPERPFDDKEPTPPPTQNKRKRAEQSPAKPQGWQPWRIVPRDDGRVEEDAHEGDAPGPSSPKRRRVAFRDPTPPEAPSWRRDDAVMGAQPVNGDAHGHIGDPAVFQDLHRESFARSAHSPTVWTNPRRHGVAHAGNSAAPSASSSRVEASSPLNEDVLMDEPQPTINVVHESRPARAGSSPLSSLSDDVDMNERQPASVGGDATRKVPGKAIKSLSVRSGYVGRFSVNGGDEVDSAREDVEKLFSDEDAIDEEPAASDAEDAAADAERLQMALNRKVVAFQLPGEERPGPPQLPAPQESGRGQETPDIPEGGAAVPCARCHVVAEENAQLRLAAAEAEAQAVKEREEDRYDIHAMLYEADEMMRQLQALRARIAYYQMRHDRQVEVASGS